VANYAFIDGTNLYMGIAELGWHLGTRQFRIYLKEKFNVEKAFYYVGYVEERASVYQSIEGDGYIMGYKKTGPSPDNGIRGNVDALLTMHTILKLGNYDKAIIVTSDGDFDCLVEYLLGKDKLRRVLAPSWLKCSHLLKIVARGHLSYLEESRGKLEYHKK